MKVLYLSARFPWPPHRGDRLTGYHLIRALSREHDVTLASFVDSPNVNDGMRELSALCRSVRTVQLARARSWIQAWAGLLNREPSQVSFYRSAAMQRLVHELVAAERPDVVFVQLFRMAQFVRDVDHPRKVLFYADSLALSLQRSLPYQPWYRGHAVEWERRRVAAYEQRVAPEFAERWVLSEVDRQDLEARGCPPVAVIQHGVDERLFALPIAPRTEPRVTFLGNLSVPHNVDAAVYLAREIWPRIRALRPDATLELAGADPVPAVRSLGSIEGVRVTGPLPSLIPVWERSGASRTPLRYSTGIQNKVLEAMAAGVPVVTTPQAAEAIGARDRVEVRVGADPQTLAAAAAEALQGGSEALERVERARELVRSRFTWSALVRRLEMLAGTNSDRP